MNNPDKFLKLVSKKPSQLLKIVEWRTKNSYWLHESALIALIILTVLDEKKLTKADLNKLTYISKAKINKMVRGSYDFSLKEIRKLEIALQVDLLNLKRKAAN